MTLPVAHGSGGYASSHYRPPQRKRTSAIEAGANVAVGVGVAIGAQITIFPYFGLYASLYDTSKIALIFTGISMVRSYMLRRFFEWMRVSGVMH